MGQKLDEVTDRLQQLFEDGELSYEHPFKEGVCLQPHNPVSGYPYRKTNRLLLLAEAKRQGYDDPRWMTFKQAIYKEDQHSPKRTGESTDEHFADWDEDCHVMKGENGVPLILVNTYEKQLDEETYEQRRSNNRLNDYPYDHYNEDDPPTERRKYLDTFTVFNAEQIKGVPEFETPEFDDGEVVENAEVFFASIDPAVNHDNTLVGAEGPEAYYTLGRDEITIPDPEYFKTIQHYYADKLHEWVHSTGHPDRLERTELIEGSKSAPPSSDKYKQYAREEFNAEYATVLLKLELGLDVSTDHLQNHAAYIKSWVDNLGEDPYRLIEAADEAHRIVDYAKERAMLPDASVGLSVVEDDPGGAVEDDTEQTAGSLSP